jgi:CHAD domain-containing protein
MSCNLERPFGNSTSGYGKSPRHGEAQGRPSPMRAFTPPAVKPPRVKPGEPAAKLIHAAMIGALLRIQAADLEARRGEVEGIHRLRTSTRRLRSELQTARELIDQVSREHLERELKWLAGMLGSVRDLDILADRLHAVNRACLELKTQTKVGSDSCGDPLQPLFRSFTERHERSSRALSDALGSDRYRKLVETIEEWIVGPPLKDDAWQPCRVVLPPLAVTAWKRLKRGAGALEESTPDEEFHEVRKRAKRARYAAELIAPALGGRIEKKAARFIRLTTKIQNILGEHQDAVVAAEEVARLLAESSVTLTDSTVRAVRALLESQRQAARAARDRFFVCWGRLDRKKTTRWLKLKHRSLA